MRSRQSAGIKGANGAGIGGQFKAHEASEPEGVSLDASEESAADRFDRRMSDFRKQNREFHTQVRDDRRTAQAARRSREQGAAAASLIESYPDVVAARFVDIGSKDLTAPNGMTMPNPDYDPQPDRNPHTFRRFELRDVLLTDGIVADDTNQPRFTSKPGVEKLADNFQDHADLVFDPQDFHGDHVDDLYKDHFHNQHVYFHQLVKDAAPRRLSVDELGQYRDMDLRGKVVEDVTDAERQALGGRTPQVALQENANELIRANGRKETLRRLSQEIATGPANSRQLGELWLTVEASKDRSLLSRMFRR